MVSSFVLFQIVIRTLGTRLDSSDVPPPDALPTVNPLESADPKNAPVTPLQSADPKTKHLKSFRIRRSEKMWGWGGKLLTRNSRRLRGPLPRTGSPDRSHGPIDASSIQLLGPSLEGRR